MSDDSLTIELYDETMWTGTPPEGEPCCRCPRDVQPSPYANAYTAESVGRVVCDECCQKDALSVFEALTACRELNGLIGRYEIRRLSESEEVLKQRPCADRRHDLPDAGLNARSGYFLFDRDERLIYCSDCEEILLQLNPRVSRALELLRAKEK